MYVARDKDGRLFLYFTKPSKIGIFDKWCLVNSRPNDYYEIDSSLFPEVKWEDEEPTEVELVKKED